MEIKTAIVTRSEFLEFLKAVGAITVPPSPALFGAVVPIDSVAVFGQPDPEDFILGGIEKATVT